jgi:hypothetical protein
VEEVELSAIVTVPRLRLKAQVINGKSTEVTYIIIRVNLQIVL